MKSFFDFAVIQQLEQGALSFSMLVKIKKQEYEFPVEEDEDHATEEPFEDQRRGNQIGVDQVTDRAGDQPIPKATNNDVPTLADATTSWEELTV